MKRVKIDKALRIIPWGMVTWNIQVLKIDIHSLLYKITGNIQQLILGGLYD